MGKHHSLTLSVFLLWCTPLASQTTVSTQPALGRRSVPILTVDGLQFKDLNRNGRLDTYEDWRRSPAERADDLLSQMSREELAGTMLHGTLPTTGSPLGDLGIGGSGFNLEKARNLILDRHITTFLTRWANAPSAMAESANRLQEMAETARLGIPLLLSTDPRHSFQYTAGATVQGAGFSKWPEPAGLAAIGSIELTRRFADIVRQEYAAVGIREALSPQADLATEPRWPRVSGTFGEDAQAARKQVEVYVEGIQAGNEGLNPRSVIAVVKHWVGYGAQKDGLDSHNFYGRYSALTSAGLAYHVTPFLGAFDAHVGTVMPTYSILEKVVVDGKPLEPVGAGMNSALVNGMLRGKYGFRGVVLSDWAITEDCADACESGTPAGQRPAPAQIGMPWGMQGASKTERFAKSVNAGVDQIGGSDDPQYLLAAMQSGKISEERAREAVLRILVQKFALGLFEDPYVDPAQTARTVGNPEFVKAGEDAQKRATVLLENKQHILPLRAGMKVYLAGIEARIAAAHGFVVVDVPSKADVAIVRASAPFEMQHPGYFFGSLQHEGRLSFVPGDAAYDAVQMCAGTPVVMTISLDRPAILTNLQDKTLAILANFGISDNALFDVLSGISKPEGRLPFELPSSMEAVETQKSELPHDSRRPLYAYGFGLSY